MYCSGRGGTCSNSLAASSNERSTVWVMRSCSNGAGSAFAPSRWKAVPRSMRLTRARPQLRAMSLAFEDQGEMVPRRGTTR